MKLLLDTHAFIWWDDDYKRLPEPLLAALRDSKNVVYLSLASIWEMQIKVQLGKLKFDIPLPEKIANQQEKNNIQLLPITKAHIFELSALSHHHRDPFDRLLIAQAHTEKLYFVSHDSKIAQYNVDIFWDASPED